MDRCLDRPGAVGVDANRNIRAELAPHPPHGFDLDFRIEHAALELDRTKTVFIDHLTSLRDQRFGAQRFAVLVFPRVIAFSATARVFVKRIDRKRYLVAHAAANQVTDGLAGGLADQIEAGRLDG